VLRCDPKSAPANVNLAVVEMRRRQWSQALLHLRRAQSLAPEMTGINLNLGLLYYRQTNYEAAIPELKMAVKKGPTVQGRYLLGLCYFFTNQFHPATEVLEANWPEQSGDLVYLYVLGIAAEQAGDKPTSERAFAQLITIGGDSPEFHLFKGKAYLNRAQPEQAIPELELAAAQNPTLPFVHFNLGWAYAKKRDFDRARSEFLKDIALEPDVPYSYEQLGAMDLFLGKYDQAESYYNQALARDSRLPSSLYGLGKIYEHKNDLSDAVSAWRKAEKISSQSVSLHNALGRVLRQLGKTAESQQEFALVTQLEQEQHADELAQPQLPSPEINREK
jgi:tetratricopeptide (TPR) repeat protein